MSARCTRALCKKWKNSGYFARVRLKFSSAESSSKFRCITHTVIIYVHCRLVHGRMDSPKQLSSNLACQTFLLLEIFSASSLEVPLELASEITWCPRLSWTRFAYAIFNNVTPISRDLSLFGALELQPHFTWQIAVEIYLSFTNKVSEWAKWT